MNKDNSGWVRIHRSILECEWAKDPLTFQLFVVCLINANHTPKKSQGVDIDRGQFITSVKTLSTQTGQTTRQIHTRLSRLMNTGEIEISTINSKTVITICNYDYYQGGEIDERQTSDKRFKSFSTNKISKIDKLICRKTTTTMNVYITRI